MKRLIPLAIVSLALLALGLRLSVCSPPEPEPGPESPVRGAGEPGVVPPDVLPGDAEASVAPADDGAKIADAGTSANPSVDGNGTVQPPPPGDSTAEGKTEPGTAKPAVRRNPRDPPPPNPRFGPGGKAPPFGPTGQWEKFPSEILRGRASVKIRVLDSAGLPIPGAEAWLGPPDIRGDASVSYAHLRKLGKADEKGVITVANLPAGSATVAGNLLGLLNGPRGLDARSAVAVTLVDDRTVEADLKLPISLASLGRISGIVRGPGGDPLQGAAVMVGYHRARTGKDGTFEVPYVPAGDHNLSITRSGYRARGEKVRLEAGGHAEVDITLEFRESGSIALSGPVTGPAGEPVAMASVYVIAYGAGSAGTVRSAVTDEQGRYSMESLPDRLRKVKVRIQASRRGYHAVNEVFDAGMRSGEVNLRFPVRLSKLVLTVLDATSSQPLTRCRFEATKEGEDRSAASFSSRSGTGIYEKWIAAGTYRFQVEAPDHEAHLAEVTIPEGGADFVYSARLVAEGAASVEISLTVLVLSSISGEPIEAAKVEVIDPASGEVVSRLENRRPGGVFTMPAPSGRRRIRVTATGHEVWEEDVDLKPDETERKIEARLTPK